MNLYRFRIFAGVVIGLSLPVMALAGALDRGPMQQRYNQAADEMIRVPGVVGMYEADAMAVLQQSGVALNVEYSRKYKEDLTGKEGTVIDQEPGAGGVSMLGSTVTITVYRPPSAEELPGGNESEGQYGNDGASQWGDPADTNPPPSYQQPQEPAPQWGGSQPATGSQPAGGGWRPPPVPAPRPYAAPAVPQPASPPPVAATPVQPTATQAERQDSAPPPISATPVQQTVTPIFMEPRGGSSNTATQGVTTAEAHREDGSCRSWYAIAVDITTEAQRIAKELGCAAVQPPAMWQACIKHIDKIGKWNVYNIQLKKRWNRLVKKTSWAAIGPRDLTFGKTHKGRLLGTTGRMFITPVPINKENVKIKMKKKAGKSRTSITVCSYMPEGDRIKEWQFESPAGNQNNGQSWEKTLTDMDGKLLSIHLDGKSVADTFQYSIEMEKN